MGVGVSFKCLACTMFKNFIVHIETKRAKNVVWLINQRQIKVKAFKVRLIYSFMHSVLFLLCEKFAAKCHMRVSNFGNQQIITCTTICCRALFLTVNFVLISFRLVIERTLINSHALCISGCAHHDHHWRRDVRDVHRIQCAVREREWERE